MNWTILTQHPSHSLVGGIVFFGYVQFQGSWHRASSQELHSKQSIGLPDIQSPPAPRALPASRSRDSPVKSVLRLERLDSGEESFDTEPLMRRRWGSDGIVTTLGSKWGPLQETLGEGLREQQLLGEGVQLEEGVCRVPASHGSPAVS